MSLRKTRLNKFEHFYFEHFFGTDVKRLIAFRKSLKKKNSNLESIEIQSELIERLNLKVVKLIVYLLIIIWLIFI